MSSVEFRIVPTDPQAGVGDPDPQPAMPGQLEEIRRALKRAPAGARLVLDFSAVRQLNSLEVASLLQLVAERHAQGCEVRFVGLSAGLRQAFSGLEADLLGPTKSYTAGCLRSNTWATRPWPC